MRVSTKTGAGCGGFAGEWLLAAPALMASEGSQMGMKYQGD